MISFFVAVGLYVFLWWYYSERQAQRRRLQHDHSSKYSQRCEAANEISTVDWPTSVPFTDTIKEHPNSFKYIMEHFVQPGSLTVLPRNDKDLLVKTQLKKLFKTGMVIVTENLMSFMNFEMPSMNLIKPETINCEIALAIPFRPCKVLCVVRQKGDQLKICRRYILQVTRQFNHKIRHFIDVPFTALDGVIDSRKFENIQDLESVLNHIDATESRNCIPNLLSMDESKYIKLQRAIIAAVAVTNLPNLLNFEETVELGNPYEKGLWFLTLEQFENLQAFIDTGGKTVIDSLNSQTITALELGRRWEKKGPTLVCLPVNERERTKLHQYGLVSRIVSSGNIDVSMETSNFKHFVAVSISEHEFQELAKLKTKSFGINIPEETVTVTITNTNSEWHADLRVRSTPMFKQLATRMEIALLSAFRRNSYIAVDKIQILAFSPGCVKAKVKVDYRDRGKEKGERTYITDQTTLITNVIEGALRDRERKLHDGSALRFAPVIENVEVQTKLDTQTCNESRDLKHHSVDEREGVDYQRDDHGRTPVMLAARRGEKTLFEKLLSNGANVALTDNDKNNLLILACIGGDLNIVTTCLDVCECDINYVGQFGWSAVMCSAHEGNLEVFNLLINRGASLKLIDDNDNCILHLACYGGDKEIISTILASIDINAIGKNGWTPVMVAALTGSNDIFQFLVGRNAALHHVDKNRNNIFHLACQGGNLQIVQQLLSKFDINARGQNGWTPVMMAAMHNKTSVFMMLRANNADLKVLSDSGKSINELACNFMRDK